MVECTGLENQQSRKALVGSNPTASANSSMPRHFIALTAALLTAGCMYFAGVPGETRTEGSRQRAVSKRVFELAEEARPECRSRKITDSEIVDLHPDGTVAYEMWTVTQCGQRSRYMVRFPAKGRGSGFVVEPEK